MPTRNNSSLYVHGATSFFFLFFFRCSKSDPVLRTRLSLIPPCDLFLSVLLQAWDTRTGKCVRTFSGHSGEISATQFSFDGDTIVSGSIDRTVRLWDVGSGSCVHVLRGHNDEILDVAFNASGEYSH